MYHYFFISKGMFKKGLAFNLLAYEHDEKLQLPKVCCVLDILGYFYRLHVVSICVRLYLVHSTFIAEQNIFLELQWILHKAIIFVEIIL